jgi:hypothetical protein
MDQEYVRSNSFIETRLKLLIDWDPTILMDGHDRYRNLYLTYIKPFDIRMSYYPTELGFVFHRTPFRADCDKLETKKVL